MSEQAIVTEDKTPWFMKEPEEVEGDEVRNSPWRLLLIFAGLAAIWYFTNTTAFIVAVGLIISIFLHELGHFMTARWTGMKATQFFLFMGPRIWSFKRGETEYGVRTYPVGAFVRIVGMSNLDPPEDDEADRAYMHKSYPRRLLVICAGSIMHMIIAFVLFVVVLNVIGLRTPVDSAGWTAGETVAGPAFDAGIREGDVITSVDGVDTTLFQDMREYLVERPGETVQIDYVRDGSTQTTSAELLDLNGNGLLCLTQVPNETRVERGGPTAPFRAIASFVTGTVSNLNRVPGAYIESLRNIGDPGPVNVDPVSTGCQENEEAGRLLSVIGIVRLSGDIEGLTQPLLLLGGVNIALGIFNMIPLLPLDGGHAAVATYERIRSRKGKRHYADFNKLVGLTYAVVILLLLFTVPVMLLDIIRPLTLN